MKKTTTTLTATVLAAALFSMTALSGCSAKSDEQDIVVDTSKFIKASDATQNEYLSNVSVKNALNNAQSAEIESQATQRSNDTMDNVYLYIDRQIADGADPQALLEAYFGQNADLFIDPAEPEIVDSPDDLTATRPCDIMDGTYLDTDVQIANGLAPIDPTAPTAIYNPNEGNASASGFGFIHNYTPNTADGKGDGNTATNAQLGSIINQTPNTADGNGDGNTATNAQLGSIINQTPNTADGKGDGKTATNAQLGSIINQTPNTADGKGDGNTATNAQLGSIINQTPNTADGNGDGNKDTNTDDEKGSVINLTPDTQDGKGDGNSDTSITAGGTDDKDSGNKGGNVSTGVAAITGFSALTLIASGAVLVIFKQKH